MPALRQRAFHSLLPLILTETWGDGRSYGPERLNNLGKVKAGGGSSRAGLKLKVGPQGLFFVTVKTGGLLAFEAQPRSGLREWGFALIPVPAL